MTDAYARSAVVAATIILLACISFFWFPGHTILQSDTQIYIPILQHLADGNALKNDIMAIRPHVSFTVYDEVALSLRHVTGLSFETLLLALQFVFRIVGVAGLYLVATGLGLTTGPALGVAALASLGAPVAGPTVLTVEYEPVPRGFALSFVLLCTGLLAHKRMMAASVAATVAFAFHPPTAGACFSLLGIFLAWQRRWRDFGVLMIGPAVLLLSLTSQPPSPERPPYFSILEPEMEKLQRMRAPYNWVSIWIRQLWPHFLLLTAALAAADWRLRDRLPGRLRVIFIALPVLAWVSLPATYVLLERVKWAIIPQYQPARYLLFITLFAALLCAVAGARAVVEGRPVEAVLFFLVPFAAPLEPNITSLSATRLGLAALLAVCAVLLSRWRAGLLVTALSAFFVIPTIGRVVNYPHLHTAELDDLATWARVSTDRDAVFQFADSGRQLYPGVFRARAERALYADWKAGGQVNFLPTFGREWWKRWREVEKQKPIDYYRSLAIDYVVFSAAKAPRDVAPVYTNPRWSVFRLRGSGQ